MRILKNLLVLAFLLAACTPAQSGDIPGLENSATPTPGDTLATFQPGLDLPSTTPEGTALPYREYSSGPLWVRLFNPQDGDVVSDPKVDVTGQAPAGTVVSVNDEFLIVPADESFTIPVVLEEGPNEIEFVASDMDGNEVTFILAIVYEP